MTITRIGATKNYSDNWEEIFGGSTNRSSGKKVTVKSTSRPAKKKKSAKKKAAKKPSQPKAAKAKRRRSQ